ncbi:MAG: hypothetical protein AAAFM81_15445, partial [Pseudomonadota bacterium]
MRLGLLFTGALVFSSALSFAVGSARADDHQDSDSSALTAISIIERAHAAAGGQNFVNPGTLYLTGSNTIYRNGRTLLWDDYRMWREFADQKSDAHTVNGKIRIEAKSDGKVVFINAFDGERSFDANGPTD